MPATKFKFWKVSLLVRHPPSLENEADCANVTERQRSPGLSIAAWLQAITAATASVFVSNSNRPELDLSDFIGNSRTPLGGRMS